jgi:GTP cyclohydrolase I
MKKVKNKSGKTQIFEEYCQLVRNGEPADPLKVKQVNKLYKQLGNSRKEKLIKTLYDSYKNILETLGYKKGDVIDLTPHRAAYGYYELLNGKEKYQKIEWRTFKINSKDPQVVLVNDIPFVSLCEHHILPFWGKVDVAYLPNDRVVGLSKIPRLVEAVTHNLQIQERITNEIADVLEEKIHPAGIGVIVKAKHMCVSARGAKSNCSTKTFTFRGEFKNNPNYKKLLIENGNQN